MVDQSRLVELFDYDAATGVFRRKVAASNAHPGSVAGFLHASTGYWYMKVDGRAYQAHRLAWLYVHGRWPTKTLDHINTVKTDNRIDNLREASRSANGANRARCRNNSTGLKGVTLHCSGRWRAQITKDGRVHYLGLFSSPQEAHGAYVRAASEMHGSFARAS